jgi:adenylosuccinate lyase
LKKVIAKLKSLAKKYNSVAMLAMTHGQPATPTTIGKELAVFCNRLQRQKTNIQEHTLLGKFGGATGTWAAHLATYPSVDWLQFAQRFIKSLKLEPNLITTQIES